MHVCLMGGGKKRRRETYYNVWSNSVGASYATTYQTYSVLTRAGRACSGRRTEYSVVNLPSIYTRGYRIY